MQERLGRLTNKCMDGGLADLEYFVQEGANIVGLQQHAHSAKVSPITPCLWQYSLPCFNLRSLTRDMCQFPSQCMCCELQSFMSTTHGI